MKTRTKTGKKPPIHTTTAAGIEELPPPESPRLPWWVFALLAFAALLVYSPALNGPFVFDDLSLQPLQDHRPEGPAFYAKGIRPLYYISLWVDHAIFGDNTLPSHLINLLLHLLNAWLAFLILRRLIRLGGIAEAQINRLALFGAAVFLLHPLNTEAVAYIASRSEVLSIAFGFAAYALFLRWRADGLGWKQVGVMLLLLACAVASKEHTVAFVPVMLLTDLFFGGRAAAQRNLKLYLPLLLFAIAASAMVLEKVTLDSSVGFSVRDVTPVTYFLTQCKVVWHYLRMFVLPVGQNIDHGYPAVASPADPLALLGLALLAAGIAAAIAKRRAVPLAAFGWLSFLALLSPTSSFIPVADALVERRLYLAMPALLLVVVQFVAPRVPRAALAVAVLICAGLTMHRNGVYADPLALWTSSLANNPSNARAMFQLAHTHYLQGACPESAALYAKAEPLAKYRETPNYINWGLALDCAGRPDEAVAVFRKAGDLPDAYLAFANIGMVEGKRGRYAEALQAIATSLQRNSSFDMAWVYRGNVFLAQGNREEAIRSFRRALELNPNNAVAPRALLQAGAR